MRRWPRFMGCTRWGAPPAKTRISELGSVHHGAHARQGNVSRAREGAQFDPRVGPAYRTHAYAHTYAPVHVSCSAPSASRHCVTESP